MTSEPVQPPMPPDFLRHCPHGAAPYMVCGQCQEQARRERFEERSLWVFERLTAVLERLERTSAPLRHRPCVDCGDLLPPGSSHCGTCRPTGGRSVADAHPEGGAPK